MPGVLLLKQYNYLHGHMLCAAAVGFSERLYSVRLHSA